MKHALTILLILIVLLQTFSRLVIEANYLINKGYIATYLCENKDKPKISCCGKCYLKKQLTKQGKEEQSTTLKKNNLEIQLILSHGYVALISTFPLKENVLSTPNAARLATFPRSVFHPPATV